MRIQLNIFFIFISILLSSCVNSSDDLPVLDGPTIAIAGENNRVYVADGYYNSRIAVFTTDGTFLTSWGSSGYGKGEFHNPHSMTIYSDGTLLIADRDNQRIQRFTGDGKYIEQWYGENIGTPWSIAVSKNGAIFSLDGGEQNDKNLKAGFVKLNYKGETVCKYSSYGSDAGALNWGHSIAVSDDGIFVYTSDIKNYRVNRFIKTIGLNNAETYQFDLNWNLFYNGQEIKPLSIALDNNSLYITQDGESLPILIFNASTGEYIGEFGRGLFRKAHSITIDKEKTFWITDVDADKVLRLNKTGNILLQIGGEK